MRPALFAALISLAAWSAASGEEAPKGADTSADPAAPISAPIPVPAPPTTGFSFGSYGRVGIGSDLRGHRGYATNVVSHGPRLQESPYIELDLYYRGELAGGRWRVQVTPAFGGDFFHYNGNFASRFTLRNAYGESEGIGVRGLRIWVGSRMYRGDDMYLFDYWPLDNLNTIGGGLGLRLGDNDFALHAGMNRLDNALQYQALSQPARGLGAPVTAVVVDRPRAVVSARYTRFLQSGERGAKLSLYGELHYLPDAVAQYREQDRPQPLPADQGLVVGAQVGGWLRPYTFANLFVRHARGLGVYGDLSLPEATDQTRRSWPASETVAGFSMNVESERIGVMAAGFVRRFSDPSGVALNVRSYSEGVIAVRPQLYLVKWLHVAGELSYQARTYDGFDPYLDRRLAAKVTRLSLMPVLSVTGKGTYARPMIGLVYTVSFLNQDARDALLDTNDVRYGTTGTVHYLGARAEWWFQSSYR